MAERKVPMRRCIGCNESKPKKELTRIVLNNDTLVIDREGKLDGRGVYICCTECMLTAAKKGAFQRSLKRSFDKELISRICQEFAQQ